MATKIDPSQYDQLRKVAEAVGVPQSTLISAVDRGEIDSAELASGVRIASIASAKKWASNRPKVGRPKKAE